MTALGVFPNCVSPSTFGVKPSSTAETKFHFQFYTSTRKLHRHRRPITAVRSQGSSSITDYDLYGLLGIDGSSDLSQIKNAYRGLQKRFHPDIAGPPGHDMAIILNEVYSILSDPSSRALYDKEQAKLAEIQGYTGKPLYSTWFGSENEQRAVFVDEVKCIGCLKCALFASNTFAIESAYGRARVVAQWADPENTILDAIQTCPVDCISIVERSDLAALEFLMSKQPRGNVRMSSGNTVGERVSNIFADIDKLQSRYREMKEKASKKYSKDTDLQREARVSAMQGIRSISNWWYWQAPKTATPTAESCLALIPIRKALQEPDIERIREIAAKRQAGEIGVPAGQNSLSSKFSDEYWSPILVLPSPSNSLSTMTSSAPPPTGELKVTKENTNAVVNNKMQENPMNTIIPLVIAAVSAVIVGFEGEQTSSGLKEHVGGSMVTEIVNSFGMQVLLAGITWYLIGAAVVGLVKALLSNGFRR